MKRIEIEIEVDILKKVYEWYCEGKVVYKEMIETEFKEYGPKMDTFLQNMIKKGYMEFKSDTAEILLTEIGKVYGAEYHYRHRTLTEFLEMIGLPSEEAQKDACRMEHVICEKAMNGISNFMLRGNVHEQIFSNTDLKSYYENGAYSIIMGIYNTDQHYPRTYAEEFDLYSDTIVLNISDEECGFLLHKHETENSQHLWYKDKEEWKKAEMREGGEWIPVQAFVFVSEPYDLVKEGYVLIELLEDGEEINSRKCRELNVHIWQVRR